MEFSFDIMEILPTTLSVLHSSPDKQLILIDPVDILEKSKAAPVCRNLAKIQEELNELVSGLGEASAKAQRLKQAVTSAKTLRCSDHKMYILRSDVCDLVESPVVYGFLKLGVKTLDVYNGCERFSIPTQCLLDFYVSEKVQRSGHGYRLLESVLQSLGHHICHIAIDYPSKVLLRFLHKHYDLDCPVQQPNNYVIYPEFFTNHPSLLKPDFSPWDSPLNEDLPGDEERHYHFQSKSAADSDGAIQRRLQCDTPYPRHSITLHWSSSADSSGMETYSDVPAESAVELALKINRAMSFEKPPDGSGNLLRKEKSFSLHCEETKSSQSKPHRTSWDVIVVDPPNYSRSQHQLSKAGSSAAQSQRTSWDVLGVEPPDYSKYGRKAN